jgi:Tol biopolymer transport system component
MDGKSSSADFAQASTSGGLVWDWTASGALHVVKEASTESIQIAPLDLASGRLSGPPVLENFRSRRPDWSRDGKFLAYQSTAASGIRVLTIRSVESGAVRVLRPALEAFNEPRWLPDGSSLMTWGRDLKGRSGIYRIDAQTGAVSFVTESPINRVQVSPDGKKIYHNIAQGGFAERDVASGAVREVLPRFASRGNPELSLDGRSLAVIVDDAAKTSAVMLACCGGEPRERCG